MACEVTITLSNDTKSLTKKTFVYEEIIASFEDLKIIGLVQLATKEFGDVAEKIKVSLKLIED